MVTSNFLDNGTPSACLPSHRSTTLLLLFLLVAWAFPSNRASAQLTDRARASVITIYPGEQLYSTFGHTAIRIVDPGRDIDRLYNYGTFDFDGPGFYLKFLRGRLDYRLSVSSTPVHLRYYRQIGRSTVEQRLDLRPASVDSLYRFLEINYRPENRYYRYDFFFDNCATRPRDALLQAIDGAAFQFDENPERRSFRQHLDPYLSGRPLIHLGIDLILGEPADRLATPHQTMFLPVELMKKLEEATVTRNDTSHALVAATDTLYWHGESSSGTFPWVSIGLWLGLSVAFGRTVHEFRTPTSHPTWTYRIDALGYAAIGIMGLIMAILALATDHAVVSPNWNLLWAWPTHLIAGHLLWRKQNPRGLQIYVLLSAIASLLVLTGWFWWPQEIPPAVIPILLWLIIRGARHAMEHRTFSVIPYV
jgi:hypothetical protein